MSQLSKSARKAALNVLYLGGRLLRGESGDLFRPIPVTFVLSEDYRSWRRGSVVQSLLGKHGDLDWPNPGQVEAGGSLQPAASQSSQSGKLQVQWGPCLKDSCGEQ